MRSIERIETSTAAPEPRLRLRARVYTAGYRTMTTLASEMGVHLTALSRVLNGHDWPSPRMQRRLADKLGLTLRELRELL
ncbi:MAG: helix-turn-helix transcriptional regulator [Deltaproteobacteria bacterium]|nr:MAG: helix-turn-helix transcriptional regulator [Deltaproteobacteria bacterium]